MSWVRFKRDNQYCNAWKELARSRYKKDDYTCRVDGCGQRGGIYGPAVLHAAHKVAKSKGGTDTLDNLITKCEDCHIEEHPFLLNDPVKRERFVRSMVRRGLTTKLIEVAKEYLARFEGRDYEARRVEINSLYSKYAG